MTPHPFKEYTIILKKEGLKSIKRTIKTDIPAFTNLKRLSFMGGLTLLGVAFTTVNFTSSMIYAAFSLPFFAFSLSLPERLHFLLPGKSNNTQITHLEKMNFAFPTGYFSPTKRFPITFIVKKYVDSTGNAKKVILGKRHFMISAEDLFDTSSTIRLQHLSFTIFPLNNYSFSIMAIIQSLKWYGISSKVQYILPIWNEDVQQSIQLRAGLGTSFIKGGTEKFTIPVNLDYRFTYTTTLIITFYPTYDIQNNQFNLLTGFGIGFLL